MSDRDEQAGGNVVALSPDEQWTAAADDLPTVQEVVASAGLEYLGSVDAPDLARVLQIPGPVFLRIQQADRDAAAATTRRQELIGLGLELLGVDPLQARVGVDLDTGAVTVTPMQELSA